MSCEVALNLDDAWDARGLGLREVDMRPWGPRLRYCASPVDVENFYRQAAPHLAPFVLYGSGDFHYLTALLVRRLTRPVTLVSFDNHPDWDRRPPRWSCGGWVCRALESGRVDRISVWGCGNFELRWPWRLTAARTALRTGRLNIYAWAERHRVDTPPWLTRILREGWREQFAQFSRQLAGQEVYVTVDLDCLRAEHAVSDWESGLFTLADLVWAIGRLREASHVVGGDVCGAHSAPHYARWTQRFASRWDHPTLPPQDEERARAVNHTALRVLWPELAAGPREDI